MSFDFSLIWNSLPLLLAGAGVTIEITAIAVGLGFIFGLITSVCRLSGVKILQVIAVCYVNIIRGTPMLVQIFLIYFALPMVIGERINPSSLPSLPARSTVVLTFRKSSAPGSSPLIKARWKPAVPWACRGCRPCAMSSCPRLLNTSSRRWATNLFP